MSEQKRRGRPPKAKPEPVAAVEGADVLPVSSFPEGEIVPEVMEKLVRTSPGLNLAAQAYALRVWNGQSPDTLARNERVRRVAAALEGQGWTMEGIELP